MAYILYSTLSTSKAVIELSLLNIPSYWEHSEVDIGEHMVTCLYYKVHT